MKLWLTSDNVDWDTERYHYAAEQMMLTLFPGERPEYPGLLRAWPRRRTPSSLPSTVGQR